MLVPDGGLLDFITNSTTSHCAHTHNTPPVRKGKKKRYNSFLFTLCLEKLKKIKINIKKWLRNGTSIA